MSACEWNPWTHQPALDGDEPHGEAVWSVGTGERNLHLCARCAELPEFKRLTKRTRLRSAPGVPRSVWEEQASPRA